MGYKASLGDEGSSVNNLNELFIFSSKNFIRLMYNQVELRKIHDGLHPLDKSLNTHCTCNVPIRN